MVKRFTILVPIKYRTFSPIVNSYFYRSSHKKDTSMTATNWLAILKREGCIKGNTVIAPPGDSIYVYLAGSNNPNTIAPTYGGFPPAEFDNMTIHWQGSMSAIGVSTFYVSWEAISHIEVVRKG